MEWTDEAAAREARKGNGNAFRVLVERHSRAVFRLAFRICGDEQDAEDLVQETFLRAYKQLNRFDERAAFATWLYRICTNCALDLLRARKSWKECRPGLRDGNKVSSWLEAIATPEPGPERLTESSQLAAWLEPALNELSAMERTAFVLRHYEGYDIAEIARTLRVQPGAAKHSIFRAVQKLRRALEPAWGVRR